MNEIDFNSILVRLKAKKVLRTLVAPYYFNSILVRLKDAHEATQEIGAGAFQFHSGAIKGPEPDNLQDYAKKISIPFWCD